MAKRQHIVQGQQQVACRGQSQRGEWLPSLKRPKRPTHLVWPVSLRVAMKDNKCGCKEKKRRDAAEIRKKAAPFSEQRQALMWPEVHADWHLMVSIFQVIKSLR